MHVAAVITGWALIVVALFGAGQQIVKLHAGNREHPGRVWKLVPAPAAQWFRLNVLCVGTGVLLLTSDWRNAPGRWLLIGLVAAYLLWDRALALTHLWRKSGTRRSARPQV